MRAPDTLTREDVRVERPRVGDNLRLSWLHDKQRRVQIGYVMFLGGSWRGYTSANPSPFSVTTDTRTAAILNVIELHNTLEQARAWRAWERDAAIARTVAS